MNNPRVQAIKHAQRESTLLKEVAHGLSNIIAQDPRLEGLYVNRVKLTPDRSLCIIYMVSSQGLTDYETKRPFLVLYKPSLRTLIAKNLEGRYTPQLRFEYDSSFEKQRSVDELIDRLKEEGKL